MYWARFESERFFFFLVGFALFFVLVCCFICLVLVLVLQMGRKKKPHHTYRSCFHRNHQHSPFHHYRKVHVRYNYRLHKPRNRLDTMARRCTIAASLYALCSWVCSFSLLLSSHKFAFQCRKRDQLDTEWLEDPLIGELHIEIVGENKKYTVKFSSCGFSNTLTGNVHLAVNHLVVISMF